MWEIRVLLLWIICVLGFQAVKSKTRLWREREKEKTKTWGERRGSWGKAEGQRRGSKLKSKARVV